MINDFGKPACSTGGFPTLRRGSLSNYVLIAQDDLNTLGYRTGGLDGVFGTQTVNAVKYFQRKNGLVVDGIAGKNTLEAMGIFSSSSSSSSSSTSSSSNVTLLAKLIYGSYIVAPMSFIGSCNQYKFVCSWHNR